MSLSTVSPTRTVPGLTMRAFAPRRRSSRPGLLFTNFRASVPKRALNLAQPVCGTSVSSMTAPPIARRVPGGTLSTLRSKST